METAISGPEEATWSAYPFTIFKYWCLKFLIQNSVRRISFTTNIWSDQNLQPFLALTAHWIAKIESMDALQFKKALIAFHRVRGRHDADSLAVTTLALLDRADVTLKVRPVDIDAFGMI